jgi:hypothetical protein
LITQMIFGEDTENKAPPYVVFSSSLWPYPLRPEYLPQHPQPTTYFPQCERPSFTPIQNDTISFLYILSFIFLGSKLKAKYSSPNDGKHSLTSVCS